MRFEEPKVEFIKLNLKASVFGSSACPFDATKCTDDSGTTESCVGSYPFAGCTSDMWKGMQ